MVNSWGKDYLDKQLQDGHKAASLFLEIMECFYWFDEFIIFIRDLYVHAQYLRAWQTWLLAKRLVRE